MGAPFLIDFGYAQKIPLDILNIIKENYNKKFYTTALKELCNIKRTDNLSMNNYKDFYGWVCGQYDYKKQQLMTEFKNSTNEVIKILFKRREDAIDNTVTLFDQKHSTDPKYPLLPLSNAVKNKMFSGLIGGKKKTKHRKRKSPNKRVPRLPLILSEFQRKYAINGIQIICPEKNTIIGSRAVE